MSFIIWWWDIYAMLTLNHVYLKGLGKWITTVTVVKVKTTVVPNRKITPYLLISEASFQRLCMLLNFCCCRRHSIGLQEWEWMLIAPHRVRLQEQRRTWHKSFVCWFIHISWIMLHGHSWWNEVQIYMIMRSFFYTRLYCIVRWLD